MYDQPMLCASRGRAEVAPVYLPASNTFISIQADYIKSVRSEVESGRKLVSFLQVWGADILHIKFIRPRQDACANCEVMRHNIQGGDAEATR